MASSVAQQKQAIKAFLISTGWTEDRFGHLHKTMSGVKLRFKFGKLTLRFENQHHVGDKPHWFCRRSGYYSKITIKDGKLVGI